MKEPWETFTIQNVQALIAERDALAKRKLETTPSQEQEETVMVRREFIEEAAYKLQEAGHVVLMHYLIAALEGKEKS